MTASLHYTAAQALPHLRKMLSGYESSIEMIDSTLGDHSGKALENYARQMAVTLPEATANLESTRTYGRESWNAIALAIIVLEVVPAETALTQKGTD